MTLSTAINGSANGGGASARTAKVINGSTGVVARIPTGLKAPLTVARDSGSTSITFAASGNQLTASIASALAVGSSLSAIARVTQADGAGVLIPVTLTGVAAAPTLSALTLSTSSATVGTAATINIIGATAGSTITGSVPDGMTLNSGARTITGTPTTAGTYNFSLTETLAGATNTPRVSNVSVVVAAGSATTINYIAEGDSITQGLGVGSAELSYPALSVQAQPDPSIYYPYANGGNWYLNTTGTSLPGTIATSGISLTAAGGINDNFATRAGSKVDLTKTVNMVSMVAGTNDGPSLDTTNIYDGVRKFVRSARAAGYGRVIVGTVMAAQTYPSTQIGSNAIIRALWDSDLDADGLFDFADPACMGIFDQANHADDRHPNSTGYARMIPYAAPVMQAVAAAPGTRVLPPTTWHFLDAKNIVRSNGNRTITNLALTNNQGNAKGFREVSSGKWYFEVKIDSMTATTNKIWIGLATRDYNIYLANSSLVNRANCAVGYSPTAGTIGTSGNTSLATLGTSVSGDTIQVAFDATAKLLWMRKAGGQWNGSGTADPATATGGIDISFLTEPNIAAAVTLNGNNGGASLTSNFAGSEITGTIPSGFSPLGGATPIALSGAIGLPSWTTAPSISPNSGAAGSVFTANPGAGPNATNTTYFYKWFLNGTAVSTASTYTSAAGTLELEVTAVGPAGSATATRVSVTVT